MLDYLEEGGMVSITASLSNQSAFQQQMKEIKGDKIAKTQQLITSYFDTYMGAFELASRVSVFMIYRDNYIAKNSVGQKNVSPHSKASEPCVLSEPRRYGYV